jgi:hypothetical protein
MEKAHNIERYLQTNPKFVNIAHTLEVAEKDRLLRHLHQNSSERAFLVSLLSKYCGLYIYTSLLIYLFSILASVQ